MKLLNHKIERKGDKVSLSGRWRDELRRPASVSLHFERGNASLTEAETPIAEGEVKDVTGALFALADIAWEMGWRPRGLMGKVAHTIESYKLPPVA